MVCDGPLDGFRGSFLLPKLVGPTTSDFRMTWRQRGRGNERKVKHGVSRNRGIMVGKGSHPHFSGSGFV